MSEPGLCTAQLAADYFLRLEPRVISFSLASVGGKSQKLGPNWVIGHHTPNRAVLGSGESATSSCRSLVSLLRPQPLYVDATLHQKPAYTTYRHERCPLTIPHGGHGLGPYRLQGSYVFRMCRSSVKGAPTVPQGSLEAHGLRRRRLGQLQV